MRTTDYVTSILRELEQGQAVIQSETTERLVTAILESKNIFTAGAGRSGLMAKAFTMRLYHMGLDAFVVGETVTPAMEQDDLLIVASGSGGTKSLLAMAEKAKATGGTTAAATIFPDSPLGSMADLTLTIPGAPKDQQDGGYDTIQPMGSLYEQTLLLTFDAIILRIMEKRGLNSSGMYSRHANLE
ncbi:6-phospho-3-hexuloisomerase [Tuberibacillus sp. Marseille-P3662]|uniref:6-phospho-3-hexuloisomerase n=1 Tax=Tuberibacillus sp. Marseille-P3662 TaxID=1965358 RepID=UPI000A1C83D1|nr:6-phospho-3-hexuloisomerase [Tuberibacillus sp. Marseille-P3662]